MAKRTMFIETPVAHVVGPGKLKIVNGRLAFSTGKGMPARLDPAPLGALFCYGDVTVTAEAMYLLLRHDVEVAWLSARGRRCYGRLVGADSSMTALRLAQHEVLANAEWKREFAAAVVHRKIESQYTAARHYQRQGHSAAGSVLRQLRIAADRCQGCQNLDALRGIEGAATAAWFGLLGDVLRSPWEFTSRVRRPPRDPVNALLSLGYTWLLSRAIALCEATGLEVSLGALHEFRPGRPSLACDVIEPFRVPAVDRWVIGICNEGRLSLDDLVENEDGVRLRPEVFPTVLANWEAHLSRMTQRSALLLDIQNFASTIRQRSKCLASLPTA